MEVCPLLLSIGQNQEKCQPQFIKIPKEELLAPYFTLGEVDFDSVVDQALEYQSQLCHVLLVGHGVHHQLIDVDNHLSECHSRWSPSGVGSW